MWVLDSLVENIRALPLVADMGLEDNSPFGLQGLARESIELLKADAIKPLAAALALNGNRDQIRDHALTEKILARNSGWVDEYCIVRLIESSLWFDGQSDFVMQMTRNPSQIPDNPPVEVQAALLKHTDDGAACGSLSGIYRRISGAAFVFSSGIRNPSDDGASGRAVVSGSRSCHRLRPFSVH